VGKGSRRRLQQIADEQMKDNWDSIFSPKPNSLIVDALNNLAESSEDDRSDVSRLKENSYRE
jgi:hypothetical protein